MTVLKPWHGSESTILDYGLQDMHIAANQEFFDLNTEMKEKEIRDIIISACKSKIPNLTRHDFEFVKRDRNRICTPSFDENYAFDYPQVKT